jgi:hypothetical protein
MGDSLTIQLNGGAVSLMIGIFCIITLLAYIIGLNHCACPTGISGFVYKEINWQEQTIKVMQENCGSGLFIDHSDKQNPRLMCWKEVCDSARDNAWCRKEYWYYPMEVK